MNNVINAGHLPVFLLIAAIPLISGCDKKDEQQRQSTISVFGTGTVLVQPDTIQMTVSLSKVAQTTKLAQDEVSNMVRQALIILKEANVEDKNIATTSLTFNSEYEYINRRVLIGQKAEQRITFSIEDIDTDNEKISGIIDRLIQINGIELNQLNFSVKSNTEYFIRSRELAFQKAVEKANQYAELSQLKIIRVLSISEEGNQQISPITNRFLNQSMVQEAAAGSGSTIVPAGELEITTRILVEFLLE
ncbi:MAG: SIMPL domain-containing protein [Treponema sp.]|jgi:uncharacterized protein YggE|nr:SIMPL domain-containing protein [Treponema sp.]